MGNGGERRLGVFRLEAGEGRSGSQGAVYRAVCEGEFQGVAVGETVALKTMLSEDEPEDYARFERRIGKLAALRSNHVVRYRGCFSASGPFQTFHVAVMDWLDGCTLKDVLEREQGGIDADEALRIVDCILSGLVDVHAAGLVHRDLKPGNVFLGRDGSVKLIDFEVAHRTSAESQSSTGGFAGTFDYMAPEFADPGFRGSPASDVFSVGVVFHEMLTGQLPYVRKTEKGEQADFAFLSRWSQRKEGLCAIRLRSSVKRVLSHANEVLLKALAENPADRYPDAAAFRDGLRQIRYREVRSASDSYRLLRLVGEGGFGCVYKARSRASGRFVAVKQLKRPEFGDRFRREARVMQRLDDSAFVRFVDYFETRDVAAVGAFLVMDFLPGMPGGSLRDAIRRAKGDPLPFHDVIEAFGRYARALAIMHRLRIYHRDIKPSNLYYPASEPARAAIMDLGIARDVSGTATTGQVPGTLDYMPPETIIGGSRGDAGMDIYALGLCLYEAISGCTGYPRLPTGPQAFSAFYERARSKRPPIFDSPVVRSRPLLFALLRDMTALDPRERLQSAELLRRRLASIAKDGPAFDDVPTSTESTPQALPPRDDSPTGVTSHGEKPILPKSSPRRQLAWKPLAWMVAAAAALILVFAGKDVVVRKVAELQDWRKKKNTEEILKVKEAEDEQQRKDASEQADAVLRLFETNTVTATVADAEASKWMLAWRDKPAVANVIVVKTNEFARAYAARIRRDAEEAAAKRLRDATAEFDAIVEDFRGTNVAASVCEERTKSWREAWLGKIEAVDFSRMEKTMSSELAQRKNRDAAEALRKRQAEERRLRRLKMAANAVEAVAGVEAMFADANVPIGRAEAAYTKWQDEWREVFDMQSVTDADKRIAAARRRREGEEAGVKVVEECEQHLKNILRVGAEDVKNWRNNVRLAELALQKAEGEQHIGAEQAETLRRRIKSCSRWTVGVIYNKTHRTVEFGRRTIDPVSTATVVFTNGYPVGASLTSEGCEPIHVLEERFASRVFTVMPSDLKERVCETKAIVPSLPDGILCSVDGIRWTSGEISLRSGRHVVRYYRPERTYPDVRDYEPKEYSFETRLSETVEVPPPAGEWSFSSDFKAARQNAELLASARKLESKCRQLLQALPVETRRARLEEVHTLLADWKAPSTLAALGVGTEKKLRAEYDAECRRVRGHVRNETPLAVAVVTDTGPVDVPPGETRLVTFEQGWPADAHIAVSGYEFVMLPQVAAEFDGATFVVSQERLVPIPVRVTVPSLEAGVTCRVDGMDVNAATELRPGEHEVIYSKPDFVSQKIPFEVKVGTPTVLPAPKRMEPSGAFSGFLEAVGAFNSGAIDAAKQLTDGIGTVEDPKRRRELEDLKRAIELRKQLEKKNR